MSEIQPIQPTAVYTVTEAAYLARVSESTMRRLARRGDVRSSRVGKMLRFLGSDLIGFLDGGGTPQPVNVPADTITRRGPRPTAVAS